MSDEKRFLALILDAPLQSWGHASQFRRRTTATHPTRSGLSGMICAALGARRGRQQEGVWLQRLAQMKFIVMAIPRKRHYDQSVLPVRRLTDYHTIQNTRKADGQMRDGAVPTHREYLMDALFGVLIQGEEPHLTEIGEALKDPVWGIWFGRKSCIPAAPVFRGIGDTHAEALAILGLTEKEADTLDRVEDAPAFAHGTDTFMDLPVNFLTREYAPRRVLYTHGHRP